MVCYPGIMQGQAEIKDVGSPNSQAFRGCISNIEFASGMTQIPYEAIINSNTRHITIPSSVTGISSNAFKYCSALIDITFEGTMEQWNSVIKAANWNYDTGTVKVICTDGSLEIDG